VRRHVDAVFQSRVEGLGWRYSGRPDEAR
jgi:hypothetical protein